MNGSRKYFFSSTTFTLYQNRQTAFGYAVDLRPKLLHRFRTSEE